MLLRTKIIEERKSRSCEYHVCHDNGRRIEKYYSVMLDPRIHRKMIKSEMDELRKIKDGMAKKLVMLRRMLE